MLHIASAVVKARPSDQERIAASISTLRGAEVIAADRGRIIVVLEAGCHPDIAHALDRIADLHGVLSATLVFELTEPEEDLA